MHFGNKFLGSMRVKEKYLALISEGMFTDTRWQNYMKRMTLQLLSTGIAWSSFGLVLKTEAKGTFNW